MMNFQKHLHILALLTSGLFVFSCQSVEKELSLAGNWHVALDSMDVGENEKWFENFPNSEIMEVPGTLDMADLGIKNNLEPTLTNEVLSHLARKRQYIGKAWFQKSIQIPSEWKDQEIELTLERIIWGSKVWINGSYVGNQESLVSPHRFKIQDQLKPGKNILTVCIDNSDLYPNINIAGSKYVEPFSKDMAHGYTNHTQIKWNGIIGEISLKPVAKLSNVKLDSDLTNKRLLVTANIENFEGANDIPYKISRNGQLLKEGKINISNKNILIKYPLEVGSEIKPWDEFDPNVYDLELIIGNTSEIHRFGMRDITSDNGVLMLNGHRIYLRGTLECAVFPLTGHPPTDKKDWKNIISAAKSYGLNHFRFHSWCPPKAAFDAADELGFYLQIELPHWNLHVGKDLKTNLFLEKEAENILREYGNHPSFILMALGNELEGDIDYMNSFIKKLKVEDPRRLYTTTSFSFQKGVGRLPQPEDDFFVTQWTNRGWIRGQGFFNAQPPHFDKDYQNEIDHIEVPIISHEIGQYSVYPDFTEIDKYQGILRPLNFMAIKKDLENKGLIDLASAFTEASGKLASLLYKEEIERALKTKGFDGFQLLQLQDFPGQGTALVGLLNVFWESKGIIDGPEFSRFSGELVPLLRFEKAVFKSGETFDAEIQVANFFKPMEKQTIKWSINEVNGSVASGELVGKTLDIGNQNRIGAISHKFSVEKATKFIVKVELSGTKYSNEWPIWVYPDRKVERKISYTKSFPEAQKWLEEGRSVILNPTLVDLIGETGRFVPVFWSPVHFPDQPATMGILCDPKHPLFKDFPTESHSNWQWWDLCIQSKALNLEKLGVTPLVRVVDNFVTNRTLSILFETKVGEGKLIFSSIDLDTDLENRLAANQLRESLENYMNSESFNPQTQISSSDLGRFIKN
ncbi:sugar-binding domain-containing protein [Aquiflexum sp.]|uniref:sugar-binding domain-containing protein n=1 Tax=Aquiflexum sp. TaxID=1872584 RepID=UPI0035944062